MKNYTDLIRLGSATTDNPSGSLEDESVVGANDGTFINKNIIDPFYKFFWKLIRDAGITPSGLEENETNGYDLVDAARKVFAIQDRGEVSGVDFDESDLTLDGTYRTLDLSSIVPSGISKVFLRVTLTPESTAVNDGGLIVFQGTNSATNFNASQLSAYQQAAGVFANNASGDLIVFCGQTLYYNGIEQGNGFDSIYITIAGWQY